MIPKARLCSRLLAMTGLGLLVRRVYGWRGLLTLAYHRIGTPGNSPFDHGLWSATPEQFDSQIRFLKSNFDVIGPVDLPEVLDRPRGRHVLITFDDGYRDNYEQAFPILRSHGVGALFFVTTGFLDGPSISWWDEIAWMVRTSRRTEVPAGPWLEQRVPFEEPSRTRAIRTLLRRYYELPAERGPAYLDYLAETTGSGRCRTNDLASFWMSWDMAREMKSAGMWFGGHTATHPILSRLPESGQARELAACRERIEAELHQSMDCFSYPVGGPQCFTAETRASLKENRVKFAFSYHGGFQPTGPCDPLSLPRTAVELNICLKQFQAMLTLPRLFA